MARILMGLQFPGGLLVACLIAGPPITYEVPHGKPRIGSY
jgi:hypothetical protein